MSERCKTCGQRIKQERPEMPDAERLYMQYAGRGLYRIVGHRGLWFCRQNIHDPKSDMMMARGPMGEALFYRAVEAEQRIMEAMKMTVLEFPDATPLA